MNVKSLHYFKNTPPNLLIIHLVNLLSSNVLIIFRWIIDYHIIFFLIFTAFLSRVPRVGHAVTTRPYSQHDASYSCLPCVVKTKTPRPP